MKCEEELVCALYKTATLPMTDSETDPNHPQLEALILVCRLIIASMYQ